MQGATRLRFRSTRRLASILRHRFSTSRTTLIRDVSILSDDSISAFEAQAFGPQIPALLPRRRFGNLPAISKWFIRGDNSTTWFSLDRDYLSQFATTTVPLELTSGDTFTRVDQPLSLLLDSQDAAKAVDARIYLAQASLADLPQGLRLDVPTPDLVLKAGRGDVYDTSIWIGLAPTYTPLHRDPNPNLFVQLAGTKSVRLFNPEVGRAIFTHVQASIGGHASATMRGEEMMQGVEKRALEDAVWEDSKNHPWMNDAFECEVSAGDGLFIPKGWWHSIKGVGEGMTGSVSVCFDINLGIC